MRFQLLIMLFYSLGIITLEILYGHDHVRYYVTDLKGEVYLYGINTTLSTILLALTSFTFYLSYRHEKGDNESTEMSRFFLIQALIFAYLALDERFMLHERIGYVLGIHDSFPLLAVALAELGLLIYYKQLSFSFKNINKFLILAAIGFTIMMTVDVFGASKGFLRLSAEDLFKLWAIFFLLQYALEFYWGLKLKKHKPTQS